MKEAMKIRGSGVRCVLWVVFAWIGMAAVGAEVDPASFGFSPDAPAATNAVALQRALDGGCRTVRVTTSGVYGLDRTIFLDDATELSFGAGVVIRKDARYSNVFANRGAWQGATNHDITVRGLHIRVNGMDSLPPMESKAAGLRGHFAFYHINRLRVFDYRIFDVMGIQYAFHMADFDDVILDGFDVRGDKDGIHINAGRRFIVRNGITRTGDDGIALNASDWPSSAPCVGTIEDGVIENVIDLPGGRCNFARLLTGATPEWYKGIVLQRGDTVRVGRNVYFVWMPVGPKTYVSMVAPTHTQGIWTDPDGTQFLYAQSDGCRMSSIRNVTFRNINLQSGRGFGCLWDAGSWARSIHPNVPDVDRPVMQVMVDGLASTGGTVFYGNSSCDLVLRGIRCPADKPLVAFDPYVDSIGGRRDVQMSWRILLTDSVFGEKGATLVFKGAYTAAKVMASGCLSEGPIRVVGAHVEATGQAVSAR